MVSAIDRKSPPDADLLEPVVILLMPRFTEAAGPCARMLPELTGKHFAVGLYSSKEERDGFYRLWQGEPPLLLIRHQSWDLMSHAVEVVLEIARNHLGRPIGVIVADGPEVSGFKMEFVRDLGERICDAITDVQVFLYSTSWTVNPPRIR